MSFQLTGRRGLLAGAYGPEPSQRILRQWYVAGPKKGRSQLRGQRRNFTGFPVPPVSATLSGQSDDHKP